MANQIDNVVVNDDSTGLNRSIDVASDDLFLSVDLTLQSGAIFEADNIKRGSGDPNGSVSGNEGDLYIRTDVSLGSVWVNTDGTNTGWEQSITSSTGILPLSDVLAFGNTTGGTDIEISSGDSLVGEGNVSGDGGDVPITGGSSTGGNGDGGDVVLTPGSGNGTGVDGVVIVNGPKHYANSATDPTDPAPAEGDRYYNTTLEMEMRYDGSRSKWLSVESDVFSGSDAFFLTNGTYLQFGNVRMSATNGFPAHFDGTVVSFGYTRDNTTASSFEVTDGGSTIATVATSTASGQDTTLDANFSQGAILAVRNGGAGFMTNPIAWVRVKWRA